MKEGEGSYHELKEKIAKRRMKKMSHGKQKMASKHIANVPKYGKNECPDNDTSGGTREDAD